MLRTQDKFKRLTCAGRTGRTFVGHQISPERSKIRSLQRTVKRGVRLVVSAACLLVTGCSTEVRQIIPANSASPSSITISISPSTSSLLAGQQEQMTVVVHGVSDQGVTWTVDGTSGGNAVSGTITSQGLYQAPSISPQAGHVTIAAVSSEDASVSATAAITISDIVTVSPAVSTLAVGEVQTFTAFVNGSRSSAVTWTVNGASGGNLTLGIISPSGVYQAPAAVPVTAILITAVENNNSPASAIAAVTLFDPALNDAHNRWLEGVPAAAASYGCSDISVEQGSKESVTDVVSRFGLTAQDKSCLVLWPVSTDTASLRYSFAWGGSVGGKSILYLSDIDQMRIWNGAEVGVDSVLAAATSASQEEMMWSKGGAR